MIPARELTNIRVRAKQFRSSGSPQVADDSGSLAPHQAAIDREFLLQWIDENEELIRVLSAEYDTLKETLKRRDYLLNIARGRAALLHALLSQADPTIVRET